MKIFSLPAIFCLIYLTSCSDNNVAAIPILVDTPVPRKFDVRMPLYAQTPATYLKDDMFDGLIVDNLEKYLTDSLKQQELQGLGGLILGTKLDKILSKLLTLNLDFEIVTHEKLNYLINNFPGNEIYSRIEDPQNYPLLQYVIIKKFKLPEILYLTDEIIIEDLLLQFFKGTLTKISIKFISKKQEIRANAFKGQANFNSFKKLIILKYGQPITIFKDAPKYMSPDSYSSRQREKTLPETFICTWVSQKYGVDIYLTEKVAEYIMFFSYPNPFVDYSYEVIISKNKDYAATDYKHTVSDSLNIGYDEEDKKRKRKYKEYVDSALKEI